MPDAGIGDSLERLESLLDLIQEAKDRHRLGDALEAALRAVNDAEGAVSRLEQLAEFTALAGRHLDSSDWAQCHHLLISVKDTGLHLCQASDAPTLRDAAIKTSQLAGQISQVDGFVRRGWKAKIAYAFGPTTRLGGVLREIAETRQLGSEMQALMHRAEQLGASADDAERSTGEFTALAAERDRAKDRLVELGAGANVVDFLLAVADQSATLANVTAEVRGWLEDRNALERFKVGL